MVRLMHKSWKYLSIQRHVVNVNSRIWSLLALTFCDLRFFRFLLRINSRQLNYVLRSQPFRNIRLFWNLLNHLFRILQNYFIQEPDISTSFTLKSLFPINKPYIVVELPPILLHFLHLQLVSIFLVNPFRQQALILHQLFFKAQLYVNQHVGSGLELYQFFLSSHLLRIKLNRLMVPTKVILQGFVLRHQLYSLVIELVPLFAYFNKVVVVTWLSPRTFMDQNSVKLVLLLFFTDWPWSKIKSLSILQLLKDLDVLFLLKIILESLQLDHQDRRKVCYLYSLNHNKKYLWKLLAVQIHQSCTYCRPPYALRKYTHWATPPK